MNCYLSGCCPHYKSGDNKPPNEHVRSTIPCVKFLDMSCEMCLAVRLFFGEEIACNINKHVLIKEGVYAKEKGKWMRKPGEVK